MYALNRITLCMHLTESRRYAFNRITHVCIYLTESHMYVFNMYAFNKITHACI